MTWASLRAVGMQGEAIFHKPVVSCLRDIRGCEMSPEQQKRFHSGFSDMVSE
uniref:Uncharacterized protein n=1 Tax=Anguilla anguilla TaxID=7936 RepID=A0A0E9WCN3_ANGAN